MAGPPRQGSGATGGREMTAPRSGVARPGVVADVRSSPSPGSVSISGRRMPSSAGALASGSCMAAGLGFARTGAGGSATTSALGAAQAASARSGARRRRRAAWGWISAGTMLEKSPSGRGAQDSSGGRCGGYSPRRPCIARISVSSSACSRPPPAGRPWAMRVRRSLRPRSRSAR